MVHFNAICQHLPFHLGANFSGSGEVRYNGRGTGDIHMSWQNSSVTKFFSCTSLHISLFLHAYAAWRRRCRSGIHPTKIMPAVGSALRNSVKWKILTMLLVLVSMSCSRILIVFCMISFVYSSDLARWGLTAGSPGSTFCLLGPVHLWANRRPRVNAKLCTCHREAMEDSPAWS